MAHEMEVDVDSILEKLLAGTLLEDCSAPISLPFLS